MPKTITKASEKALDKFAESLNLYMNIDSLISAVRFFYQY